MQSKANIYFWGMRNDHNRQAKALWILFKNGNRRYKYLALGHEETYFVRGHSDSKIKYSGDDIIKMLEFLVDNIFVIFDGQVLQQTVGIPMGTNCAPLLADIFCVFIRRGFNSVLALNGKETANISV